MPPVFRSLLLSGSAPRLSIISIVLVAAIAFGSYLTVQTVTENNVRQALLDQQMQRQIDNIDAVSARVAADIDSVVIRMQLLATEPVLQSGELASDRATELLVRQYRELNKITSVEGFHVLDENNIMINNAVEEQRQFIGSDVSETDYVIGVRERLQPYVSSSFTSLHDKLAFAVAVPITNRETEQYVGTLVARFVLPEFFERYQDDLPISNIVALDRKQVYISSTIPEFLGLDYWGEHVQTATRANPKLNEAYSTLASGKPASTLFVSAVTNDERFISGSPVFYGNEQVMSVVITTPTAAIYAQVDDILFAQKIQTIAMLAAVVAAISVLILYLSKWNRTLEAKVGKRTEELNMANKNLSLRNTQLAEANKQLQTHDKLQKEFINIAAHELRTPVQPLLGVAEIMDSDFKGKDKIEVSREDVDLLVRNARRLERLSSDLLEVAKIESGSMHLNLEQVDISEKIRLVVEDSKAGLRKGNNITIVYQDSQSPIFVQADRTRLFEVLSNLLRNAIKFTEDGTITISAKRSDEGNEAIVEVKDTGSGIDPEIMPKLFTKFASKSDSGTGIGLFIAKSIVEAHGGKIWAENNKDGAGATFTFMLPLAVKRLEQAADTASKT